MNSKSIESYKKLYDEGVISKRQAQVLKVLSTDLKQATNRMIAKHLDWDINRVTGRVSELREKGLVEHAGDFYDSATERTVNLWKCK
jgi:DNA-binding MarR family transcriptional regulator